MTIAKINLEGINDFSYNSEIVNSMADRMPKSYNSQSTIDRSQINEIEKTVQVSDDLYYMLHPKSITDIVGKNSHKGAFINAIKTASRGLNISVPVSNKKYQTYQAMYDYRKAIKRGGTSEKTVVLLDFEDFSGRDAKGINQILGIHEYSFKKFGTSGKIDDFSGVVGFTEDSEIDKLMRSTREAVLAGRQLTEQQSVAFEFFSRIGSSIESIKKIDGRWINTGLKEVDGFKTIENFDKAYKKYISIGRDQVKDKGSVYGQFAEDIINAFNESPIVVGHNIEEHDIPVLRETIRLNNELREVLDGAGFDFDKVFGSEGYVYDTYKVFKHMNQNEISTLFRDIYPNGMPKQLGAKANSYGPLKAESLYFGIGTKNGADFNKTEVHHSAHTDVEQMSKMLGLTVYDGAQDVSFNPYETIEDKLTKKGNNIIDPKNPRKSITIMPTISASDDIESKGIYATVSQGGTGRRYHSSLAKIIENDDNTANLVNSKDNQYSPRVFNKNTPYTVDFSKVRYVEKDNVNGITFDMVKVAEDGKHYKSDNVTTVFVPGDKIEEVFEKYFRVIKVDDELTQAGTELLDNIGATSKQGIKRIFGKEDTRRTLENAQRRILDGSLDSLLMADEIARFSDAAKVKLNDIRTAMIKAMSGDGDWVKELGFVNHDGIAVPFGNIKETFTINGDFNPGWFDNVIEMAGRINTNSPALMLARAISRDISIESYDKGIVFNRALTTLKDSMLLGAKTDKQRDKILGKIKDRVKTTDDFTISLPGFIRSVSLNGQVRKNNNITLNLSNSDYAVAQLMGYDSTTSKSFKKSTPEYKVNVIQKFSDQLYEEYINLLNYDKMDASAGQFAEEIEEIKKLLNIARDKSDNANINPSVKMSHLQAAMFNIKKLFSTDQGKELAKRFSLQTGFVENEIENILASKLFTDQVKDIKASEAAIEKIIEDSIPKSRKIDDPERLINMLGGNIKDQEDYFRSFFNPSIVDEDVIEKRVNIFGAHLQAVSDFSNSLIDSIKNAGGKLTNKNGQLLLSFDGDNTVIDITGFLPKLQVSQGTSYFRIGGSSYATSLYADITRTGELKASSMLGEITRMMFSRKRIERIVENSKTGKMSKAEGFRRLLSDANEMLRQAGLASTTLKDSVRNVSLDIDNLFKNKLQRDNFETFLYNYLEVNKDADAEEVYRYIKDYKDDGTHYINLSTKTALYKLIDRGIINSEIAFGPKRQSYTLGIDAKDTYLEGGHLTLMDTATGTSVHDNPFRGASYVRSGTANFNKEEVLKRIQKINGVTKEEAEEILEKGTYRLKTQNEYVHSKDMNEIGVIRHNTSTSERDRIVKKIRDKYGLASAKRVEALINTYEGGAAIAGSVVRSLGYVPGSRVIDVSNRRFESLHVNSLDYDFDEKTGKLKEQDGYFVKKGEQIIKSYSSYGDTDEDFSAKENSFIKRQFYAENNIPVSIDKVNDRVNKYAKSHNIKIRTKEDFMRIAKELGFNDKVSATPVFYSGSVKTLSTQNEKATTQIIIDTIEDAINNSEDKYKKALRKVFMNEDGSLTKYSEYITKILGDKWYTRALEESIFESVVKPIKGKGLFRGISNDDFKEIESLIKTFDNEFGENAFSEYLYKQRRLTENMLKDVTKGATFFADQFSAAIKHKDIGQLTINTLYRELMNNGVNIKDVESIIGDIIGKNNVKKGEGNQLVLPNTGYDINYNKLENAFKKYGIDPVKIKSYEAISIIQDAANQGKKPKLGIRELNKLMNNQLTDDIFKFEDGEVLDESWVREFEDKKYERILSKVDGKIKIKEDMLNRPIWNYGLSDLVSETVTYSEEAGEQVINDFTKDFGSEAKKYEETYEKLRSVYGQDKAISKEYVYKTYELESANIAKKINTDTVTDKFIEENVKKYGFEEVSIKDIDASKYNMPTNRQIWNKNAIVNLVNEEAGLTAKDFGGKEMAKIFVPGAAPGVVGNNLILKDYQEKFRSLANDISELETYNKMDKTDPKVAEKIEDLKKSIVRKYGDYNKSLKEYVNNSKEGVNAWFLDRRSKHANRAKATVYDVVTLKHSNSLLLSDKTFNGQNLNEAYSKRNYVGFALASTKDLESYGYDNKFFEELARRQGVDVQEAKRAWLEEAKTKGVKAIVNRSPSDYRGSTKAIQLYFDDSLNKGQTLTDSITAAFMKEDADGDTGAIIVAGVRDEKGNFYDSIIIDEAKRRDAKKPLESNAIERFDKISASHTIDMYATQRFAKKYMEKEMTSDSNYDPTRESDLSVEKAKYWDLISEQKFESVIYAKNRRFLSKEQIAAHQASWDNATQEIEKALQNNREELNKWNSYDEMDKHVKAMEYLNKEDYKDIRAAFSDEQLKTVRKGIIDRSNMINTMFEMSIKVSRSGVGEIDAAFFNIDTLKNIYQSSEGVEKLTQKEISLINYLMEAPKEGFTSPKNTTPSESGHKVQLAEDLKSAANDYFKGGPGSVEAKARLVNALKYSRDITSRYQDLAQEYDGDVGKIIEDAMDVVDKIYRKLLPNYKGTTYELRDYLMASALGHKETGVMSMYINEANKNIFKQAEDRIGMLSIENLKDIKDGLKDGERRSLEAYQEILEDFRRSEEAIRSAKKGNPLVNIIRNSFSTPKGGWSKSIAALAGAIMFTGYVGGNPSEPSGSETQSVQETQTSYGNYSEIPTLTDSALTSMRNGPRRGYIININAQTNEPNEYASRIVSNAINNNFSNSQVNISMNVNETQSSMSSDDIYNYLANSL